MRVVVTGGAGFIGSAVCRHLISSTDWSVVNLDKLTYAANLASLAGIAGNPRYRFIRADIADRDAMRALFDEVRPDAVLTSQPNPMSTARSILQTTLFTPTSTGPLSFSKRRAAIATA